MLLDDIGAKLIADTSATAVGDDVFLSLLPDKPDVAIGIVESSGLPPVRTMGNAGPPDVEIASFQITVRGAVDDYASARTTANEIYRVFASAGAEVLNSVSYLNFEALSSPFAAGYDANERPLIICNYTCHKAPSP